MNQKTALKILGLGPGASLAQAKKAFRNLAKEYHPDRYPPGLNTDDEIGADQAEARMNRMKQINQAFHLLAPLLGSADSLSGKVSTDKPPVFKDKKTRSKQDISFMDILRMLKKELKLKFHKKAGFPRPSVKQSVKSTGRRQNRYGKTVRFASVLHSLHPNADLDKKSKDRDSRVHPYANFVKYMDLKKKIDARTRSEQNFNRIEKIKPVTRVNPIGDKK